MADKIKLRRDTQANWEAVNPILDEGELGWITDKYIGKLGDGTHGFNDLRPLFNVPEDWYNIKDFGAKGDGTTDDTNAIQSAINTVPDYSTLYAPKGTYLFSNLTIEKPITIIGYSPFHSIFKGINENSNITINNVNNVKIKNIGRLNGLRGLSITNSSNSYFEDLYINNIGTTEDLATFGLYIYNCNNIFIDKNTITNIIGTGNYGGDFIYIRESTNVKIKNSYFEQSERQGIAMTNNNHHILIDNNYIYKSGLAGIAIETNDTNYPSTDITISNNIIDTTFAQTVGTIGIQNAGIDCHDSAGDIFIKNNTFKNIAGPNIYAMNGAHNIFIENNVLNADNDTCFILCAGSGALDITIKNNIIYGSHSLAQTYHTNRLKIINNKIYLPSISIHDSQDITFSNNYVPNLTNTITFYNSTLDTNIIFENNNINSSTTSYVIEFKSGKSHKQIIKLANNSLNATSGSGIHANEVTGGIIELSEVVGNTINVTGNKFLNFSNNSLHKFLSYPDLSTITPITGATYFEYSTGLYKVYDGTNFITLPS